MATFVKGDFVQVTPKVDWRWDQWKIDHTNLCEKTCKVVDTNYEKWTDQLFVEVEHRGKRLWFLDRHLIKVDNYEEVFQESIHRACENLQKHEEICKNLRDEILHGVFGTEPREAKKEEQEEDELYEDWQEATTKEVIPLPGNGGTMTTPPDPKASADSNRKKIRKIKKIGKKMSSKNTTTSGSLSSTWTLSEEELQELQDYIDELPYVSQSDSSGDIDYGYNYDDWDGDGNAD